MNKTHLIAAISLSIISVVFGFVLTINGKPYNQICAAFHKITSIGAFVVLLMLLWPHLNLLKKDVILLAISAVAVFSFVASIASGAILLSKINGFPVWLIIHRISPFLTITASFISVLRLLKK